MPNRLASETSPYLLQHAGQPRGLVPVGRRGVRAAPAPRTSPMLVSIGYAACHWCHVMERESFEDPEVAALMNDALRVHQGRPRGAPGRRRDLHGRRPGDDRPRRLAAERVPDARRRAVLRRHLLPAASRATGMPSLAQVLDGVCERVGRRSATRSTRPRGDDRAAAAGRGAHGGARRRARPRRRSTPRSRRCARALRRRARRLGRRAEVPADVGDRVPAGARRARDAAADAAPDGRRAGSTTRSAAASRATRSTRAGSSRTSRRCSTTTRCSRGRTCTRFQVTGEPLFRRVCEETLDWALRELRQDEGGFASSLDADSEGVEGKFYVWTARRGPRGARRRARRRRDRALRRDRGGQLRGREHPRARDVGPGRSCRRSRRGCSRRASSACGPALDDKRLTAWNALMISALADAGAALGRADYLRRGGRLRGVRRARAARRRRPAAAHLQPRPREAARLPGGPRVPARGAT